MLDFCAEHGIVSDIEMIPIQEIEEAYDADAEERRQVPLRHRHGVAEGRREAHRKRAAPGRSRPSSLRRRVRRVRVRRGGGPRHSRIRPDERSIGKGVSASVFAVGQADREGGMGAALAAVRQACSGRRRRRPAAPARRRPDLDRAISPSTRAPSPAAMSTSETCASAGGSISERSMSVPWPARDHPGRDADVLGRDRAGIADGELELDDGVVLAGAGADRAHQEFEPRPAGDRLGIGGQRLDIGIVGLDDGRAPRPRGAGSAAAAAEKAGAAAIARRRLDRRGAGEARLGRDLDRRLLVIGSPHRPRRPRRRRRSAKKASAASSRAARRAGARAGSSRRPALVRTVHRDGVGDRGGLDRRAGAGGATVSATGRREARRRSRGAARRPARRGGPEPGAGARGSGAGRGARRRARPAPAPAAAARGGVIAGATGGQRSTGGGADGGRRRGR